MKNLNLQIICKKINKNKKIIGRVFTNDYANQIFVQLMFNNQIIITSNCTAKIIINHGIKMMILICLPLCLPTCLRLPAFLPACLPLCLPACLPLCLPLPKILSTASNILCTSSNVLHIPSNILQPNLIFYIPPIYFTYPWKLS